MIVRKTLEEMETALEVSRDQMVWKNPTIKVIEPGLYSVAGSKGFYRVKCGRTRKNNLYIECMCRGGQHGQICYHAVIAFDTHVDLMKELKSIKYD